MLVVCDDCQGRGVLAASERDDCPFCDGVGFLRKRRFTARKSLTPPSSQEAQFIAPRRDH